MQILQSGLVITEEQKCFMESPYSADEVKVAFMSIDDAN